MKRDDMLKKLNKYFEKQFAFVPSIKNKGVSHISEDVLTIIEKTGMAPPWYDKLQDNNGDVVVIPAREWEDEDE